MRPLTRLGKQMFFVIVLFAACCPRSSPAQERRLVFRFSEVDFYIYQRATNEQQIAKFVWRVEGCELYERISVCEYLVSNRLTTNRWAIDWDPAGNKGKHDLRTEIGRAAYVIERLTGTVIPPPAADNNGAEIARYRERIKDIESKWVRGEVARELSAKNQPDRETLRSKYEGKMVPGFSASTNDFCRVVYMCYLMKEWFPIGRSVRDLEFIVGHPPNLVKEDEIAYVFRDPWDPYHFRFMVRRGEIQSVIMNRGDLGLWGSEVPHNPLVHALGRLPADLFLMPVTNAEAEGSAHAEVEARDWEKYLLSENVRTTNAVKATFQPRAAGKYAEYEALALKYGSKAAWERTGMDKLSQYDVVSFTYKVGGRQVITKQTRWMWMALFQGEGTDGKSSSELASVITSIAANCFNSYTNHDFGRFYGPDPPGTPMFMSGATNEIDSGVTDWRDDARATVHADTIAFYGPKQKQDYRTNSSLRVPMDEESNREWFDDNGIAVKDRGKGKDSR